MISSRDGLTRAIENIINKHIPWGEMNSLKETRLRWNLAFLKGVTTHCNLLSYIAYIIWHDFHRPSSITRSNINININSFLFCCSLSLIRNQFECRQRPVLRYAMQNNLKRELLLRTFMMPYCLGTLINSYIILISLSLRPTGLLVDAAGPINLLRLAYYKYGKRVSK
jgi:hypothetical protein